MAFISPEESVCGVSLFERLEADAEPVSPSKGPVPSDVMRSIKRNVANILNTRYGESLSSPRLGVADFNDTASAATNFFKQARISIKQCLQEFEPRLKDIDVVLQQDEKDPMCLLFHVTAVVNTSAIHKQVTISLLFDSNRRYRVISS